MLATETPGTPAPRIGSYKEVPPTIATAAWAAADAFAPVPGQTILVTGINLPVVCIAAQLIRLCGARVLAVVSAGEACIPKALGIEAVGGGQGVAGRVRAIAPSGISGCLDGETVITPELARDLGIVAECIHSVTTAPAAGGDQAVADHLRKLTEYAGLTLPAYSAQG
ncbi:MAG: hypothetical protein QOF73_247 [Thermomicrobiales bacterium]|nr:hypothetical protein [Thermomicrobiales bacterium]